MSGPSITRIANSNSLQTTVTNLVAGTYIFELSVTDDKGASAKDSVQVKVVIAENKLPIANPGADHTITISGNNSVIVLDGTGSSDSDGITIEFTECSQSKKQQVQTP